MGSHKGMGKETASAKLPTSVINRCLVLDRDLMTGFISEHICGLLRMNNVCGINDERAWELLYDIGILDPVMTRHISPVQLMRPHHRGRCLPFQDWRAAIRSDMAQMFDTTLNQMNNCRWDIPSAFSDYVDPSNLLTTSSGKVQHTGECSSWYSSPDRRALIAQSRCWQYKPDDLLAGRPLNWVEIIDGDDDDGSLADP